MRPPGVLTVTLTCATLRQAQVSFIILRAMTSDKWSWTGNYTWGHVRRPELLWHDIASLRMEDIEEDSLDKLLQKTEGSIDWTAEIAIRIRKCVVRFLRDFSSDAT